MNALKYSIAVCVVGLVGLFICTFFMSLGWSSGPLQWAAVWSAIAFIGGGVAAGEIWVGS